MRADPRAAPRCSPTIPTASPSCTTPGPRRRRCAIRCCCTCMPTARPSARLLEGDPALARLRQQQAPRGDFGAAPGYLGRWGDFIIGLTYLWEGQVLLAEKPAAAGAGRGRGRPGPAQPLGLHARGAARRGGVGTRPPARPRRCWPTGSTCSSAAACRRPCCSATARWRASPWPRAPSTARWSCSARCTRSGRARACRACASPAWPSRCACTRAATAPRPAARSCERIDALLAAPRRAAGPAVAAQRRAAARAGAWLRRDRRAGLARARSSRWRAPRRWRSSSGSARLHIELLGLRAFALDRCGEKLAGAAARGDRPRRHLRPAARLRRRAPGARRLGARARRRRGAALGPRRRRGTGPRRSADRERRAGARRRRAWR